MKWAYLGEFSWSWVTCLSRMSQLLITELLQGNFRVVMHRSAVGMITLLFFIGQILGTVAVEIPSDFAIQSSTNCSVLRDGLYPDYSQACRMFFACSKGEKRVFWCTKGYVFSSSSGHCEPPDRVRCSDMVTLTSQECDSGDGVFPDFASACGSFYLCQRGRKTTFQCPASTLFDWRTKSCRPPRDVSCDPLTCDVTTDGIFADRDGGCKRYVECRDANKTERICPQGTIFNTRTLRCTRTATTRCPSPERAQCLGVPDGYYPDFKSGCKTFDLCLNGKLKTFNCPANTAFSTRSLTCETGAHCQHKTPLERCEGKPNGIHADFESGCKDFIVCVDDGLAHTGCCPQGKLLNPVTGTCQPRSLVTCSPVRDPDCDGKTDGLYPDYGTGCSAYYACLAERRVVTSYCNGHDLFDVSTGRCLPSAFVLCRPPSLTIPTSRPLDNYKCDGRIGVFPEYSSQCTRYVVCAYGHKTSFSCGQGEWFNPSTSKCEAGTPGACRAPVVVSTFQCLPSDEGIYGSSNCRLWHECWKGIGFSNMCPEGFMFNITEKKCEIGSTCTNLTDINTSTATLVSEVRTEFDCSLRDNDVYPDSECTAFHICAEGKTFSYSCPSQMVFNPHQKQCIFSKNATCAAKTPKWLEKANSFTCDSRPDGMYSDYTASCRRYYVCEGGKTVLVYCPERQKFSTVKMVCDDENKVACPTPNSGALNWTEAGLSNFSRSLINHSDDTDKFHHSAHRIDMNNSGAYFKPGVTKSIAILQRSHDNSSTGEEEDAGVFRQDSNYTVAPNDIANSLTNKRHNSLKYYTSQDLPETHNTPVSPTTTETALAATSAIATPLVNYNSAFPVTAAAFSSANGDPASPCPRGDTGFFPDYESGCKKFHICFRTIKKTYNCPSVLLFNPESKNCDLPENVECVPPQEVHGGSYDCRGKRNKFYPDFASECRKYVSCLGNLPFLYTCPKGKKFSPISKACEPEASVNCNFTDYHNGQENAASSIHSNNDGGGIQGTEETQSSRAQHVHGIPRRFLFDCTDKADGFYPDYVRHCHVFYRCVRGKKFSHYCKQGLLFNPEVGICDFEENVVCSPGNTTQTVPAVR